MKLCYTSHHYKSEKNIIDSKKSALSETIYIYNSGTIIYDHYIGVKFRVYEYLVYTKPQNNVTFSLNKAFRPMNYYFKIEIDLNVILLLFVFVYLLFTFLA